MGVVSAVLKFAGADWFMYDWNKCADGAICSGAEAIAIIPLVLLVIYMIKASLIKDSLNEKNTRLCFRITLYPVLRGTFLR